MSLSSRRQCLLLAASGWALGSASTASTASAQPAPAAVTTPAARVAVELTFLQSRPGQLAALRRFVELNWFEMDRIAVQQGLMKDYVALDSGSDDGPWNLLVVVTYNNPAGYRGIAEAFERIRSAHRTVLVDGLHLRELGRIVESKTLFDGRP
jgi:hypothetical protein